MGWTHRSRAGLLRRLVVSSIIVAGLFGLPMRASAARVHALPEAAPLGAPLAIEPEDGDRPPEDGCVHAAQYIWLGRPFANAESHPLEHTFLYGIQGAGRAGRHTGVDVRSALGTPVIAGAGGRIVYAGDDSTQQFGPGLNYYGKLVLMEVAQGAEQWIGAAPVVLSCGAAPFYLLYAHLDRLAVEAGQWVRSGDIIGSAGMTGIAMGPHLHLEVRAGSASFSATRNPGLWLRPLAGQGVIAGRLLDRSGRDVADDRILVYKVEAADRLWRIVHTYPVTPLINRDGVLQENFVLPDVPPGEYRLVAGRTPNVVRLSLTVQPDRMTFVELALPE